MPTYDYKCTKCDKQFSLINRISERHNQKCTDDSCKADAVLSISAPLMVHGGFYDNITRAKTPL